MNRLYTQRHDTIRPFHPEESEQVVTLDKKLLIHESLINC